MYRHLTHGFWAHARLPPNDISISSVVFAGLTRATDRYTDRQSALRHAMLIGIGRASITVCSAGDAG